MYYNYMSTQNLRNMPALCLPVKVVTPRFKVFQGYGMDPLLSVLFATINEYFGYANKLLLKTFSTCSNIHIHKKLKIDLLIH